jgi:hypothetical protein
VRGSEILQKESGSETDLPRSGDRINSVSFWILPFNFWPKVNPSVRSGDWIERFRNDTGNHQKTYFLPGKQANLEEHSLTSSQMWVAWTSIPSEIPWTRKELLRVYTTCFSIYFIYCPDWHLSLLQANEDSDAAITRGLTSIVLTVSMTRHLRQRTLSENYQSRIQPLTIRHEKEEPDSANSRLLSFFWWNLISVEVIEQFGAFVNK